MQNISALPVLSDVSHRDIRLVNPLVAGVAKHVDYHTLLPDVVFLQSHFQLPSDGVFREREGT